MIDYLNHTIFKVYYNFREFHEFFRQFGKTNIHKISQNLRFAKISTREKKDKFSKIDTEREAKLKQKTKSFSDKNFIFLYPW